MTAAEFVETGPRQKELFTVNDPVLQKEFACEGRPTFRFVLGDEENAFIRLVIQVWSVRALSSFWGRIINGEVIQLAFFDRSGVLHQNLLLERDSSLVARPAEVDARERLVQRTTDSGGAVLLYELTPGQDYQIVFRDAEGNTVQQLRARYGVFVGSRP